jgi:MFS family permease
MAERLTRSQQRGIRMAFTNLAVFGGAFFTPIVVGKITNSIGWWWTFYLVAIFCAACFPLVLFFCPETAYRRDTALNLDLLDSENPAGGAKVADPAHGDVEKIASSNGEPSGSGETTRDADPHVNGIAEVPRTSEAEETRPKATFAQSLALFNGRKTDEKFWKLLLRPFPLFFQPAFFWACLIQGLMIGWTVFIGVILAQFFLATPLWWGEEKTGYAYTAAFIGAIIGFIIAGGLSDWSARVMTRMNGGVYEPEFRIVLVIPQMILGCAGLYGWGRTVDGLLHSTYHYAVPLTFFALEVAGMVIGAVASSHYLVDANRNPVLFFFLSLSRNILTPPYRRLGD